MLHFEQVVFNLFAGVLILSLLCFLYNQCPILFVQLCTLSNFHYLYKKLRGYKIFAYISIFVMLSNRPWLVLVTLNNLP